MKTKKLRGYKRKLRQAFNLGEKAGFEGKTQEACNPYNTTSEYGLRCSFKEGQTNGQLIKDWFDDDCQMGSSINTMIYERTTK